MSSQRGLLPTRLSMAIRSAHVVRLVLRSSRPCQVFPKSTRLCRIMSAKSVSILNSSPKVRLDLASTCRRKNVPTAAKICTATVTISRLKPSLALTAISRRILTLTSRATISRGRINTPKSCSARITFSRRELFPPSPIRLHTAML